MTYIYTPTDQTLTGVTYICQGDSIVLDRHLSSYEEYRDKSSKLWDNLIKACDRFEDAIIGRRNGKTDFVLNKSLKDLEDEV